MSVALILHTGYNWTHFVQQYGGDIRRIQKVMGSGRDSLCHFRPWSPQKLLFPKQYYASLDCHKRDRYV